MITQGLVVLIFILLFGFILTSPVFAYTTNMSASVVIGQSGFTTNSSDTTSTTLKNPRGVKVCDGKLIVADMTNHRVLIWNSVPTSSGTAADVVLGQADFTSGSANRGGSVAANTLNLPWELACANGRLFVADGANARVLIYNSIPTSNGASADIVVGQTNMTSSTNHNGDDLDKLSNQVAVGTDGTKLVILDSNNQRFLVFNTIPTSNGASADIVVGGNNTQACSATTLGGQPDGLHIGNGKLFVGDTFAGSGQRVLIWNSIPTTNNQAASVVVGQPDFTSCTANNGGIGANTVNQPFGVSTDSRGRMLIADRSNQRILIFNSVPGSNGAYANLVIGQPSFTTSSSNQGGTPGANTLTGARFVTTTDNKIIVSDGDNNRLLIFYNINNNPGMTLNNSPEGRDNGLLRLRGTVSIPSTSLYTISTVQYTVNGVAGGATATDGSFNSKSEDFYFDFNPKTNQQRDSSGNLIEGYTVVVKSMNTNLDETDHLFYFSPFNLNEPLDNAITSSLYPTFDFSVIKQINTLKDNLSKYQIQARLGGNDSTAPWQTIIDDIPIEGNVDNDNFKASYTDDSSRIKVYSKKNQLFGSIQWKAVAVDKTGHTQDSNTRSLKINTKTNISTSNFPLAILNISGLGNPYISTTNLSAIKDTYYLGSINPIFYGIAFTNAKVTLSLTDQSCDSTKSADCTKTYSTITNPESRYGINIPKGDLKWGKKYTTNMSVALNQDYNELPAFTLSTSGFTPKIVSNPTPTTQALPTPTSTPMPEPQEARKQETLSEKHCFFFLCF